MIKVAIQKSLIGSSGPMKLDVSLKIAPKSFVAVTGESGSGKTTLLRILEGLEKSTGTISVSGRHWLDAGTSLPTQSREIGFVFQDYALFENMTVKKNLLFVRNDKALAGHLLELTGLEKMANRYPGTLSGGQKQRVALCRALMNRPKILLMDEPLSALDPAMRTKLQQDILKLHREFGTTTLMVSHDPSEIYRLADRVILLDQGKVQNDGTPKELLLHVKGSQKFTFSGELLEIVKADAIHIAIISIGQQIVEVVLDKEESRFFKPGDTVQVSTKAFAPTITRTAKTSLREE
jgi:molybdate transport system ATP-binding protein